MAYTKTTWVNNSSPKINATNLNNIENGIEANDLAIQSLVPKYYYTNSSSSLTITPTENCYCEVLFSASTWGYDGGEVTVSISIDNSPVTIYNYSQKATGSNATSREITARGLFKLTEGITYTISGSRTNSGGVSSYMLLAKTTPNFE